MEEVGAEEELSAGQGQAGQEVSAGLEEPGGEAGATRGLAEGQRGALAWRSLEEGQRGALAWRSLTEGRWPGGARRRGAGLEEPDGGWRSPGLEGCCLADGGGRRSVFKRGVFLYFCAFSPGRRGTPNDNYFGTEGVHAIDFIQR